ncbi:MAG TPA: anti-sigma factor [Miltoncostaeaceae bacterium]|nr:anti-sigma factor [Miltoncostaeaceae bacterium]
MTPDSQIVDYLLGELAPDERAAIERRMREDPGFRREVERMRPVVAGLEALPSDAWERREVPPLPDLPPLPAAPAPEAPRPRWPPWAPVAAVAACAALIAVGLGIGALVFGGDGGDDAGPAIALARVDDGGPSATGEARVVASDQGGLRLRVNGLEPSAPGGFSELGLLDGAERLLSLGAFRVPASGAADVTVPLPVDVTDFRFIDVSAEREDGDPGHSGVSVLRGPTAPA